MNAGQNFRNGTQKFPITSQADLDAAVGYFKFAVAADPTHARAQAWLAYCFVTALIDLWSWKGYGIPNALTDDPATDRSAIFEEVRKRMAEAIKHGGNDYDVYWAGTFAALHAKEHQKARTSLGLAINKAPKNQGDGLPEDAFLLAEMADCLTYLGDLETADLYARTAIARFGLGTAPDWLYWVRAWVQVCLAETETGQQKLELLESARTTLLGMKRTPPEDSSLLAIDPKYDFDALALWCVIRALQDDEGNRKRRWQHLLAALVQGKKRDGKWSWERERERHPFDLGNDTAKTVRKALVDDLKRSLKD